MAPKRSQSATRRRKRVTPSPANQTPRKRPPQRRVLILAASLCILAAAFFFAGGPTRLIHHFAAQAVAQHDWEEAKSWLELSERISPRNPRRFFLAARVARHEGDLQRMSSQLDLALQNGFDAERVRRERVLAQAQAGRLNGIEPDLNEWLLEGGSDTPEISDAYANGLATELRLYAALQILDAWHRDYPHDPVPLYRIGRIHEHSDQFAEAKENYRAAIALDENFFPAHYSLGRLLLENKEAKDGMEHFTHCLQSSRPAAAKVGIARCLIELGESQKAAALLDEVMKLDAEMIQASYRMFGETPERFVAAAELGKLEANAGNYIKATRLLDLALEENPRDLAARYSRAVALRGLGRHSEAQAEFDHVQTVQQAMEKVEEYKDRISRNPEDTEARLGIGKLYLQHDSQRTGLFWLRSVLVYDADNAQVHEELANYYGSLAAKSPSYAELAAEHRRQAEAID